MSILPEGRQRRLSLYCIKLHCRKAFYELFHSSSESASASIRSLKAKARENAPGISPKSLSLKDTERGGDPIEGENDRAAECDGNPGEMTVPLNPGQNLHDERLSLFWYCEQARLPLP
nr:hypothetical protein CFP56_65957 [Quercus suber]